MIRKRLNEAYFRSVTQQPARCIGAIVSIPLTLPIIVLAGIAIGIFIAAPVGPVNILCIQRTLARGYWAGVGAGTGAVAGDGLISAAAAFGLTAIKEGMAAYQYELQIIGGLVLLAFGVSLLMSHPTAEAPADAKRTLSSNAVVIPQTFLLTVTNPGAILGVFALIGGLGSMIEFDHTYLQAGFLVLAIMGGSLLWWVSLSWVIAIIHHKLDDMWLRLINQFAGIVLLGFGTGLLARLALGFEL